MAARFLHSKISIQNGLIFYLMMVVGIVMAIGYSKHPLWTEFLAVLPQKFSALQILELVALTLIIKRVQSVNTMSIIELIMTFCMTALILFFRSDRPEYALACLCIFITFRWMGRSEINLAVLAIAAFAFQYAAAFGPLFIFHQYFAHFDANVIRILLVYFGFPTEGTGTFIEYAPTGTSLIVNVGCTSSLASIYAISATAIFLIYRNARIDIALVLSFIGLILTIMILNWLRIGLMIESADAYRFWHEGGGMQIVSLINALAILAFLHIGLSIGDEQRRRRLPDAIE